MPRPASGSATEPVHLVDTTMFWSPTGGGVRRYVQTKHAWLAKRPMWRHTIAVPQVAGALRLASMLPSWPLPGSDGYRLPLSRSAIARVLVALAPDVIEAGDPYRVAWGARDAAATLGIPAVAYCHSNIVAMARLAAGPRFAAAAERVARAYARRVYSGFDLVLAPSRAMARHLADWGLARVACQPLGVDSTAFHPSRADPAWRVRHGFAASTRLLVYAGRFAAEKHLDVLVAAVQRLGPPYALVLVGAGPAQPPPSPGVTVLPFVSGTAELATALASADAFVHAGDQETFGLSVLEAMACGTPAIVRDAEGLGELVAAGSGIAVPAGTPAAFAEAIAALFEGGDGLARSRAEAARAQATASDWNRVLPELEQRYLRLLGRDAVPAPVDASRRAPSLAGNAP